MPAKTVNSSFLTSKNERDRTDPDGAKRWMSGQVTGERILPFLIWRVEEKETETLLPAFFS